MSDATASSPAVSAPAAPLVRNRWLAVLGALLIQICLGAIYAWSVFTPSLIAAGWTRLQTQVVFSVGLAVFALVMVWAGRKLPVWGPRKLVWAGGLVLGLGYAGAGLLDATNFAVVTVFVGVIGGAGIGLGYVVPIAVGMRWFPDKKGLITGLAVAGFGFGAMGWVKLAGAWGGLIANLGLANTFIIYGVAFAALVLVGGIWMVFPPKDWKPEGWTPPAPAAGRMASGQTDFSVGRMLETPQFYLIFLAFTISAGAGLMTIGLMKLYPVEALVAAGMDKAAASAVAGTAMAVFFSLANGVGRIAWGSISDRFGRKRSLLAMTTLQGFVVIAFPVMAGHEGLLFLAATLIGFNFGGNFALFPTITADTFGTGRVGQNYPYVFLAYGVGGIAGPVLGGLLGDTGEFPMAFSICGIACILAGGLISMLSQPKAAVTTLGPEDAEPAVNGDRALLATRPLAAADAEVLSAFPRGEREATYMFPQLTAPVTAEALLALSGGRTAPTVALFQGELAGYADFMSCQYGICELGAVAVNPEHHRRGVGAYLVETMAETARRDHGGRRLRATVDNENTAALLFYHQLGFHSVGMEPGPGAGGRTAMRIQLEKSLQGT